MNKTKTAEGIVTAELAGARLDQALARLAPEISRRLARKIIAMGAVHVGKRVVRIASYAVREGDRLSATWHPEVLEPESFPLVVVHEDADVVVVDKPAGQLSQGSELGDAGSLIHALGRRFGPDVRLMHRLDKGASGLLVAARHSGASAILTPQFRDHTIGRRYMAVCAGVPSDGPCDIPIVISGRKSRAAMPHEDGLPARSDVLVRRTVENPRRALVDVTLFTGRTHQIRIHLAALGAPIIGDAEYGGPTAARLCLHAAELRFIAPQGRELGFERTPGADFWEASGIDPELARARLST